MTNVGPANIAVLAVKMDEHVRMTRRGRQSLLGWIYSNSLRVAISADKVRHARKSTCKDGDGMVFAMLCLPSPSLVATMSG
jgi:hypothetical protein